MNLGARRAVVAIVLGSFLAIGSVSAPVGAAESDPKWRTGGDSRACSAPISFDTVGPSGPGVGRRVVVIGDSMTRNSRTILRKSLRKSGWNPTIRCFGGKRLDWGMSQIRDHRRNSPQSCSPQPQQRRKKLSDSVATSGACDEPGYPRQRPSRPRC